MGFIKCMMAGAMLLFSGHSMALFMPEGFSIKAEIDAVSDQGCDVLPTTRTTTEF